MTFMYTTIVWVTFVSVIAAKTDKLKFSPEIYKEVFGENEIFYAPGTNAAVPLLTKSSDTSSLINLAVKDRGSKGVYGWLPCFCFTGVCNCCVDIQIRSLNTRDTSCISVATTNDDSTTIETGLFLNNRTLIKQRVSFDNSPPLCVPFPPFPAISLCVRLNEIMREDRNVRACVNFELRITGTLHPLWTLRFTCVRFGFNGISFFRPSTVEPSLTPTDVELSEQEQLQNVVIPSAQQGIPSAQQVIPPVLVFHQFMSLTPPQSSSGMVANPLHATTLHVLRMSASIPPPQTSHLFLWPLDIARVDDPRPLCSPFPSFPFISGCIHFNKLRTDNGRIRGCARMEIRVSRTNVVLWEVQFSCFRVGSDGIVITRPGIPGNNKNKVKPNPQSHKLADKNKNCEKQRTDAK